MTIYPFMIHLGRFEITGYGLMMMVAFLVAGWIMRVDLKERGLNEDYAGDIIVAGGDRRHHRRQALVRGAHAGSRARCSRAAGWCGTAGSSAARSP